MKNSFKLLILTVAATCASCTQENGKDFPYNVPQAYLEEASNIPAFWKATTREVNDFLQNYVRKGRYEFLGESAGGRPIYAVTYGSPRQGKGTTTYSGASSINKIATFRGPESYKKVYMAIAGVHGFELEGIVGIVNLISVFETGKDLTGKAWPEIESMLDSLDRIVLVPICNPDGRDRVPIRMEKFRGSAPDAYLVHEYLNTGGLDGGKLIGWPACKEYIPLDFTQCEFPGSYPNDNGYNIMHDDFFGKMQPETRILCDLAKREKPDVLLNMHTGVSRDDYFIEVCRPCVGAYSPLLERVWEDFYRTVHTDLTLGSLRKTNDLKRETTPKTRHIGTGDMNLTSVLSFHCGALAVTVEDGSHGYTGVYDDGTPVEHTPQKILTAELTVHQAAMKFLCRTGGADRWGIDYADR
mgnify:CR=1 FL=1